MDMAVVPRSLHLQSRKRFIGAFELLQAKNVRRDGGEIVEHVAQPLADRIDVPGRDTHEREAPCTRRTMDDALRVDVHGSNRPEGGNVTVPRDRASCLPKTGAGSPASSPCVSTPAAMRPHPLLRPYRDEAFEDVLHASRRLGDVGLAIAAVGEPDQGIALNESDARQAPEATDEDRRACRRGQQRRKGRRRERGARRTAPRLLKSRAGRSGGATVPPSRMTRRNWRGTPTSLATSPPG